MKKICLLLVIIIGCAKTTISTTDLEQLNGYWEINEVIFSDGETKEYKASNTIDFFKIDSLKGFRKKVQPKIGGTFIANKDIDSLQIIEKEGAFRIYYSNGINEREEQIISISKSKFMVTDNQNTTYIYKRYEPILLD